MINELPKKYLNPSAIKKPITLDHAHPP